MERIVWYFSGCSSNTATVFHFVLAHWPCIQCCFGGWSMHKHTHTQHTYLHIFKPNEVMRIPSSGPYLCPLLHRGTEKCRQHKCSRSIEQAYTSSTTLPSHWSAGAVQCSILFFFLHISLLHIFRTLAQQWAQETKHINTLLFRL